MKKNGKSSKGKLDDSVDKKKSERGRNQLHGKI